MSWQEEYRSLFQAIQQCTYMDNAYDCGSTTFGIKAIERYFDDWTKAAVNVERGGPGRQSHFEVIDETRGYIAELCGCSNPNLVAFTRNTNEGLNAILQGFPFEQGDNVVTNAIEHHSVIMPAVNVGKTKGVEVRVLPEREDETIPVEDLMSLVDQNTKMMLVSHVQSVTGYRIDLEELGKRCHEKGVYLVVDAIQSLGLEPFMMEKWHVDAVNAAGYKSLNAVNSIGFTVYSEELLDKIWPPYIAAGFVNDVVYEDGEWKLTNTDSRNARKMENSSLDNPGIYVLHDSLEILRNVGINNINEHVLKLFDKLHDGLSDLGYPIITPKEKDQHLGIVSIKPTEVKAMFDHFRNHNVALSISAGKYVRFSLGGFNNEEDVDRVLEIAKLYKRDTY